MKNAKFTVIRNRQLLKLFASVIWLIILPIILVLGGWAVLLAFHANALAVRLYPNSVLARIALSEDSFQNQRYHDAITELDAVLSLDHSNDKNSQTAYRGLGNCYFNLGQYSTAEKEFSSALRIDPNDSFSLVGLGSSLYNERRYDAAVIDLDKAIRLKPSDLKALQWLKKAKEKASERK